MVEIYSNVEKVKRLFNYKKQIAKFLTKSLYYRFIGDEKRASRFFEKISKIKNDDIEVSCENNEIAINSLFISLYYAIESYNIVTVKNLIDSFYDKYEDMSLRKLKPEIVELLENNDPRFNRELQESDYEHVYKTVESLLTTSQKTIFQMLQIRIKIMEEEIKELRI